MSLIVNLELRKRKEKVIIDLSDEDLKLNPEKILQMLKKECVDLKSWFYVILFYYSIEDYQNFKRFSDELANTDVDTNPYYRDQKQVFIYILNIFSFFYSHLSQKSKEKNKIDEFSTLSTSFVNKAEKISMYDPMTMICKGFLFFAQGDYDNSEMYFSNVSDSDKSTNVNKNIVILAKLGRALNAYNKANYTKAIEYYTALIREFNYINENVLESLGICFFNTGNVKKASDIFNKVLELNAKNYKVHTYLFTIELSNIENENFKIEELLESLDKLKQAYAEDEENEFHFLLINLANVFLLAGKFNQAEEICTKLTTLLDLGEMKVNKEAKGKGDKYRRDLDEIKSSIFCFNAKINHYNLKSTEALTFYTKSVSANPKNIEAQFGLGQINILLSNLPEAEKCFEVCKSIQEAYTSTQKTKTNNKSEISFEINKYLAFIYARTRKKEVDKTVEMFRQALEIKNDDTDCFIELAELLEFRKPEESLKLYEQLLVLIKQKNQDNITTKYTHNLYNIQEILPEILNNVATIKIRLHLLSDVDNLLQESLSIIQKRTEILTSNNSNILDEALLRLNSLEQAVTFNFGLLKEAKCEFDEAYKYYKDTIKKNPDFVEAYVKLGELARLRGNKRKAVDYLTLAVEKHFKKALNCGLKDQLNQTDLSKNLNPNSNSLVSNLFQNKQLIPIMKKPVDPCLLVAQISHECGNDNEALSILNSILKVYADKDPYTLVFIGNIYYDMAAQARGKEDFNRFMSKSLEMYYCSLEADKYNAYAAIGIANVLCEFNMTSQALETYKLIIDKQSNNHNAHVNEALVYMNQGNFEKSAVTLTKLLKRFFKNKCPEIENILAKALIELKDFDKASKILKGLMLRHPENIYYKFNYALCLKSKAEEIFQKSDRRVRETEEAMKNIDKAIPIFEALFSLRKEIIANFKNERDERILKTSDFYNKCSEILQFLHVTRINSREMLEKDKIKENEILKKIEENRQRYNLILENMSEMDKKERSDLEKKLLDNERISDSFKDKFDKIIESKKEIERERQRKGKKEKKVIKEDLVNDNPEDIEREENESSGEAKKAHKKRRLKRHRDEEDKLHEVEEAYVDPENKKLKKLRKKHKAELEDDLIKDEDYDGVEENVYQDDSFKIPKENNINQDVKSEIKEESSVTQVAQVTQVTQEIEMKDYSKNVPEEEVDYD